MLRNMALWFGGFFVILPPILPLTPICTPVKARCFEIRHTLPIYVRDEAYVVCYLGWKPSLLCPCTITDVSCSISSCVRGCGCLVHCSSVASGLCSGNPGLRGCLLGENWVLPEEQKGWNRRQQNENAHCREQSGITLLFSSIQFFPKY